MSSDRNQRPWSSGYPGSSYRDPNQRNRFRQNQSSEYQRSNSNHSGYQDRHRQSEYTPSVYSSRRNNEQSSTYSNHYRRDHHGSGVRSSSFFPNNNEERPNRNYYNSQQRNPALSSEENFRGGSSYTGDSRFASNRSNSQGYGSQRFHYNDSLYNDRYSKQFDYYGKRRSGDDHGSTRRLNRVHSFYNGNRPSIQSGSQDEDFYEPRRGNDDSKRDTSVSEKDSSKWRQSSRPSLIPKDFKDEDDEEEEEEDLMKELKERSQSRDTSTQPRQSPTETNTISERIPLSVEHKEELDQESNSESREISEEPSKLIKLKEDTTNIDEQGEKVDEIMISQTKISVKHKPDTDEQALIRTEPEREKSPFESSESSDSYDPEKEAEEVLNSAQIKEMVQQDGGLQTLKLDEIKIEQPKVKIGSVSETESKPIVIVPLENINYSMFPLPKVELSAWEYKNYPKVEVIKHSPYLLKTPIIDFREYPFYERNYLVHEQLIKPKLQNSLAELKEKTLLHKRDLLNEYSHRLDDWNKRLDQMSKQQQEIYGSKPDEAEEEEDSTQALTDQEKPRNSTSRRAGRYHGDAVHSEAEFLEILKNLEKEKEDDPLYRAEQLAAKIPDMILNPINKSLRFTNINNLVLEKENWTKRINTDGIDNFTKHEHELFCEAFLAHPKKFGRISQEMGGLRTARECVLHYYKTKKSLTDYKQLLALKKKKNRKVISKGKRNIKPKTGTSLPSTPVDASAAETSGDELNLENFIPKEANEEVVYTETGRRKRAAAPTFDSKDKKDDQADVDGRKRSLETTTNSNEVKETEPIIQQPVKVKKQRGPKPKRHLETAEGIQVDTAADGSKVKSIITSYWSVRDINLLTNLLNKFGNKWDIIADELKTKSAVMVRNYYHRNADRHGWRGIAEAHGDSSHNVGAQISEAHIKNPPLGFFTAQTNVPSNISFSASEESVKIEQSALPRIESAAPATHNPLNQRQALNTTTILPQLSTFVNSREPLPLPLPLPVPNSSQQRSNPFSITNLLNPSEERKVITSTLPIAGTFDRVEEKRELYSAYKANSGRSHAIGILLNDSNTELSKPFTSSKPSGELSSGLMSSNEKVNSIGASIHYNDVGTKAALPSYQSPFFEKKGSRSILNDDRPLAPLPSTNPQVILPSIETSSHPPNVNSSSLRNILSNDPLDQAKQP